MKYRIEKDTMGYVQMGSYVVNVNGTTITTAAVARPYVPTGHVQPRQRHPVRATGNLKMSLSARCRQRRVHRLFPRHRQVSGNGNFISHRTVRASFKRPTRRRTIPLTRIRRKDAVEDDKDCQQAEGGSGK